MGYGIYVGYMLDIQEQMPVTQCYFKTLKHEY